MPLAGDPVIIAHFFMRNDFWHVQAIGSGERATWHPEATWHQRQRCQWRCHITDTDDTYYLIPPQVFLFFISTRYQLRSASGQSWRSQIVSVIFALLWRASFDTSVAGCHVHQPPPQPPNKVKIRLLSLFSSTKFFNKTLIVSTQHRDALLSSYRQDGIGSSCPTPRDPWCEGCEQFQGRWRQARLEKKLSRRKKFHRQNVLFRCTITLMKPRLTQDKILHLIVGLRYELKWCLCGCLCGV